MSSKVPSEKQSSFVCEYYRSFIQSAMEPIIIENPNSIDWQLFIGVFLQDKLEEMYKMDSEDVIQFIFENKPSSRLKEMLRDKLELHEDERRTGLDRRGTDRREV